jgi:hypothetical protein
VRRARAVAHPRRRDRGGLARRGRREDGARDRGDGRGAEKGDLPTDPKSSEAREVVLSFRVSVATAALFRDALQALRREAGSHLSDDDALTQLARTVLQGPRDQGRASYQIAVDVCPSCKKATRTTDGESVPIDEAVVAMAACDAEVVDLRPPTERVPEGTPQSDATSA